mmetsp:Transcript_48806/g.147060  ORF Transcript_48806/g.147060 Transcript_48806/m.147060 type:complete len:259 (-) Transcript_48806:698-1474(-)
MLIHMRPFLSGAQQVVPSAPAIVIDVFRAFSLVPYALSGGAVGKPARTVVPVRTEAEALAWRERAGEHATVLAGEAGGKRLPGFDLGNSPASIAEGGDSVGVFGGDGEGGKIMVHRTSAGTQGLLAAVEAGAHPVLTGSFVNAGATARYLRDVVQPDEISIVAMGYEGTELALEDTLCAEYLKSLLLAKEGEELSGPTFNQIREEIRRDATGLRFFDPELPQYPEPDFDACITLDIFDFAVKVDRDETFGICLKSVAN